MRYSAKTNSGSVSGRYFCKGLLIISVSNKSIDLLTVKNESIDSNELLLNR